MLRNHPCQDHAPIAMLAKLHSARFFHIANTGAAPAYIAGLLQQLEALAQLHC